MRRTTLAVMLGLLMGASLAVAQATSKHQKNPPEKVECFGYDWPKEEVDWIISKEERAAYYKLTNDEERENFIEMFWMRRDPTPDTVRNELRDEHYRRILYANEHYSTATTKGWRTDRGRIYVTLGKPDALECTDFGERWRYRYIGEPYFREGKFEEDIKLRFVDACKCGDMRLERTDPGTEDLLKALSNPWDYVDPPPSDGKLQLIVRAVKFPAIHFKELEELQTAGIRYSMLPFQIETEFKQVTKLTTQVAINLTFHNADLSWKQANEMNSAGVHTFIRFVALTGKIEQTIEDEVANISKGAPDLSGSTTFHIIGFVSAGVYKLDIVLQDANSDKISSSSRYVEVSKLDWCR
jgi:GWxTD domain-containing protein